MWDHYDQARALKRTADIIRTNGLAKGKYEHGQSKCIIGSLRAGMRMQVTQWEPEDFKNLLTMVAEALAPKMYAVLLDMGAPFPERDALIKYNDAPKTSAVDVIRTLEALSKTVRLQFVRANAEEEHEG